MNLQSTEKRRNFIKKSLTLALSISGIKAMAMELENVKPTLPNPAIAAEVVHEFVSAAHINLLKVKEMLAKQPMLVNACWDWGGGDFEIALGGPSHMGNRDIANFLLDSNARIDAFCAAMLGEKNLLQAMIKSKPNTVNVRGPHKYSLLYHVAISGDVSMADMLKPYLEKESRSEVCNRSVQAAAKHGHAEMIEWLFINGANNANTKDVLGRSILQIAEEKGDQKTISILKKYGAK